MKTKEFNILGFQNILKIIFNFNFFSLNNEYFKQNLSGRICGLGLGLGSIVKYLDLIEIRFKNLPSVRSVQQHRIYDVVVKIELSSFTVDR